MKSIRKSEDPRMTKMLTIRHYMSST